MTHTIRIAGVQMDRKLADVAGNLARCLELLSICYDLGFPEYPRVLLR